MTGPELELPVWVVTLIGRQAIELELARQENGALRDSVAAAAMANAVAEPDPE